MIRPVLKWRWRAGGCKGSHRLPGRYGCAVTLLRRVRVPASDADIRQIFAFFRVALTVFLVTLPGLLVRAGRN
jgi:hypothetical protein